MRITFKLLLATIAATGLLALVVSGGAFARRFRVDHIYEAQGEFEIALAGGAINIICKLTLQGTFHSASGGSATFSKVCGALVAVISHAENGACVGGNGRALTETLPWHVRYRSFSGTLPSVSEILYQLVGASIRVAIGASSCLIRTTAARPLLMSWSITGSSVHELRFLATAISPEPGCSWPGEGMVAGVFAQENTGTERSVIALVM